jgi:charged multivesicular body protein 4
MARVSHLPLILSMKNQLTKLPIVKGKAKQTEEEDEEAELEKLRAEMAMS